MKKILLTLILLFSFSSIISASDKIEILHNWENAHTYKKANSLSSLYSATVTYYRKSLSKKKCITDKKRALKKYPNFSMRIDNIKVQDITNSLYKITFDKYVKIKSNGKEKNYPSYLVISNSKIIEEGDVVTDKIVTLRNSSNKHEIIEDTFYWAFKIKYLEYLIQGNGEKCRVKYNKLDGLENLNCISLSNSKGIKILCTKNKKICKTEDEVLDVILKRNRENNAVIKKQFNEALTELKNNESLAIHDTPKEICTGKENEFSEEYQKFIDSKLDPKETDYGIFYRARKARDSALIFIKACKGIPRNTFWNGGYKMEDIREFIIEVNEKERLLDNAFR